MILIVGRKIILTQGDDEAFRILLRDFRGNEVNLSSTDIITLRMRYSMETDEPIYLSKVANAVQISEDEKFYHIIQFSHADTIDLPEGDYYYDVILETDNKRFTIVPKSILTLEKSMSFEDIENDDNSILIFDSEPEIDYTSVITSTPLVGSFPETSYTRVGAVDEIILF